MELLFALYAHLGASYRPSSALVAPRPKGARARAPFRTRGGPRRRPRRSCARALPPRSSVAMVRHMTGDAAGDGVHPRRVLVRSRPSWGACSATAATASPREPSRVLPPNPPSYALAQEPESGKIHARYVGASYQIMYGRVIVRVRPRPDGRGSGSSPCLAARPLGRRKRGERKGKEPRRRGTPKQRRPSSSYPHLILSHGNAVDVALYLPFARYPRRARVNVLAYDYTGYGCSDGHPRAAVSDVHADLEAAVRTRW